MEIGDLGLKIYKTSLNTVLPDGCLQRLHSADNYTVNYGTNGSKSICKMK